MSLYKVVNNNRDIIEVNWETWDKHCFHIYRTFTRKGMFGYLKRVRYKLAEINYYPKDRSDEVLFDHFNKIIPIIKQYKQEFDATVDCDEWMEDLIVAHGDKQ